MARNATQALFSVVKLNENICFFDTEVAVFDSAIDEHLSTRRTETDNPQLTIIPDVQPPRPAQVIFNAEYFVISIGDIKFANN